MRIFNYFEELKKEHNLPESLFNNYNIVNINGKFVYVEGHKGLLLLGNEHISFKIKNGFIDVKGASMKLKNLSESTLIIEGKIYKIEVH